jgi:hypothetical protein
MRQFEVAAMETSPEMVDFAGRAAVLYTVLPGPTRKRTDSSYRYQITYRNPEREEAGCLMTWLVIGGRQSYQIALEQDEKHRLHWHCTCADAIYRAEQQGRLCKHVQGLLAFGWPSFPLLDISRH